MLKTDRTQTTTASGTYQIFVCIVAMGDLENLDRFSGLWTPQPAVMQLLDIQASSGAPGAVAGTGYDDHKPRTPPPDLPSLLLDSRIVYLGMPVSCIRALRA